MKSIELFNYIKAEFDESLFLCLYFDSLPFIDIIIEKSKISLIVPFLCTLSEYFFMDIHDKNEFHIIRLKEV